MRLVERLLGRGVSRGSGAIAKERLTLVLQYDRARLTPADLEHLKNELLDVIAQHVEVERDLVQVRLQPGGGRLVVDVPLSGLLPRDVGPENGGRRSRACRPLSNELSSGWPFGADGVPSTGRSWRPCSPRSPSGSP